MYNDNNYQIQRCKNIKKTEFSSMAFQPLGRGRRQNVMFSVKKKEDGAKNLAPSFSVPSGTRTLDPLIKSQLLYQLS